MENITCGLTQEKLDAHPTWITAEGRCVSEHNAIVHTRPIYLLQLHVIIPFLWISLSHVHERIHLPFWIYPVSSIDTPTKVVPFVTQLLSIYIQHSVSYIKCPSYSFYYINWYIHSLTSYLVRILSDGLPVLSQQCSISSASIPSIKEHGPCAKEVKCFHIIPDEFEMIPFSENIAWLGTYKQWQFDVLRFRKRYCCNDPIVFTFICFTDEASA